MPQEWRPDQPVARKQDDRLDRGPFVRRIAAALIAGDGKNARGIVLGLVGPWGSGKSSVLGLLAEHLATLQPKPIVVRFNPWIVSGQESLIRAFFLELLAAVDNRDDFKKVARKFIKVA